MAWGCGAGACCVPCRLVSEQFSLFGAERHQEGKLALPYIQNAFRGSSWCASAANCKMCFPLFPLYITTPKRGCSSVLAPILCGMCQCRNVTCVNTKVFSLAACFIVTKENEPLLRRLYAAHSSAFPLVSCACGPCLGLSQHVLEAAQRGQLTVVSWSDLVAAPLWHLPALHGTTRGKSEWCLCSQCCPTPPAPQAATLS